ncbi:MAG: outer membrane beta-barrel protein [Bacteroidales bacterium]|nr:outer membrane beta-barrel protein [Bacteroidales bacterium]
MKNSLSSSWLIFLLMIPFIGGAQNESYEYQGFGLKAGENYFNIDLQPSVGDISAEVSYSGGLVYVFSNKKNVGLQVEALFSSRKWKENIDEYVASTELQYLEIPLMTNINFGAANLKYILNLGTYFAVNLDKKLSHNLPETHEQYLTLVGREERNSDFGLLIGGALRYLSPVGIFQLDIRFAYGYQKIYNEEATGFRFSNMSGLNAGIIYMINLHKNE